MCSESRSAACGGAGTNSTYGVLNSLNVHRKRIRISTPVTGANSGSVIDLHCRHGPAPSTAAASYSSLGMLCIPANVIKNANGHNRHTVVITMLQNALLPSSQNGRPCVRCRSSTNNVFNAPLSRSSMKLHPITATYTGIAYGTKNSVRNHRCPRNSELTINAPNIPNAHANPTTNTVNATVISNECKMSLPIGERNCNAKS